MPLTDTCYTIPEVIFLRYQNLHELFYHSSSSRRYFLSLPIPLQLRVSEHAADIHTAADLREIVRLVEKHDRAIMLSET